MDGTTVMVTRGFDDLYEASRTDLARQLFALSGDWPGSCDLVQEAFVRCWARWDRISGYDDPAAYVRRVAYNLAKSRWRRSGRSVLRATPPERPAPDPDTAGHLDLVADLRRLGVNERTAIALHHLAGLSVEETASEMGVPTGTVKSWLARGRSHLASYIAASTTPIATPTEEKSTGR